MHRPLSWSVPGSFMLGDDYTWTAYQKWIHHYTFWLPEWHSMNVWSLAVGGRAVKSSLLRTRILDMTSAPPEDTLCSEKARHLLPIPVSQRPWWSQSVLRESHYSLTHDLWLPCVTKLNEIMESRSRSLSVPEIHLTPNANCERKENDFPIFLRWRCIIYLSWMRWQFIKAGKCDF